MFQESNGSLNELSTNDLTGLDTELDEEAEDIFNQLADPSFELEQFFDFSEEKVRGQHCPQTFLRLTQIMLM